MGEGTAGEIDAEARRRAGNRRQRPGAAGQAWDAAQELAGVGMAWRPEDCFRRVGFDHGTRVHHGDTIADLGDQIEVVADKQHGEVHISAQSLNESNHLRLDRDIQCRGRLVGDEQLRLAGNRHGDGDALAHAAAELVRICGEAGTWRGNADERQELSCPLVRRAAVKVAVGADGIRQLPFDRKGRIERGQRVLRNHRNDAASHRGHLGFGEAD